MQKITVTPIKAIELVVRFKGEELWNELHTNPTEAAFAWSEYVMNKRYGNLPIALRDAHQSRAYARALPVFRKIFESIP